MTSARQMAQEYAKAGFGATFVMNGGAAVAILSQASDLVNLGLNDDVARALLFWACGVGAVPIGWLFGFLSLRYVDRSEEQGAQIAQEIRVSNLYMYAGMLCFLASVALFLWGSYELAKAIGR